MDIRHRVYSVNGWNWK